MGKIKWTEFDLAIEQVEPNYDYRCEDCGHEFTEDDAVWHEGNARNFQADMDACPECDSENLEEL